MSLHYETSSFYNAIVFYIIGVVNVLLKLLYKKMYNNTLYSFLSWILF